MARILTTFSLIYIMIYISEEASVTRTAKLFQNGRSQAIRLPAEYRFEGSEVYIRRDAQNGDVILSRRPESWQQLFHVMDSFEMPEDFLSDRGDAPPQKRRLF